MRPVWAVKAMFVIVLASIFFRCVCGANHTVGGASGWDLESNMQDWASTESFNVGDDLVFSYTPLYDVIEVNQQGYNTCTIANAISTHNSGETVIHLTESGTRYFVCGRMGRCQQGLKLEVKVQAQSNNTGTSPPSPPKEIEKFKEIGNETSSPDDDGSTKCRSEAAGPSAVDLEFHDSCSSDYSDKLNSSTSTELLVANLNKCKELESELESLFLQKVEAEVIMQFIHSLKLSQDALQQEIEKFKEIGNETSSPDDDGSTKCRSEAAGRSAVDLEFHDSCSSGHKQNSSTSMELLVANLTKCEKLEVIMQSIHSLKLSQDALQQEPVVVFEVESFENQMSVYSYLGDAQIDGYQVSLSNEKLGPAQQCVSSGALFFNSPMNFYDFKMRRPLSFKTSFRFSISTLATPIYFGDGISFIISPIISLGDSPFAYPKIFFGVAIDTNMDPFGTPSEIYVRLFDNSLSSFASAKFIENIRSGEEYTCWIEFEGISKVIMLYLDIGLIRPVEPLLVTRVDALDTYLSSNNGNYFVGLTASSNGCTEVYQIYSWAFMIEKKKQVEEEVNLEQKTMELYRAYTQNSILATLAVIASVVAIVVGASLCLDQEKQKMKV